MAGAGESLPAAVGNGKKVVAVIILPEERNGNGTLIQ
jgi:hypothetical protein